VNKAMFIFIASQRLTLFPTEIICPNWSDQRQQTIHRGYASSLRNLKLSFLTYYFLVVVRY